MFSMANKILLFRIGTALAMIGISFLVSLLPGLIHENSYVLFDATRVATCSSLLAIGMIYQVTRATQLLGNNDTDGTSVVSIIVSTSLITVIILETLVARRFDALVQQYCHYSGIIASFIARCCCSCSFIMNSFTSSGGDSTTGLGSLSGYRPVSTLETHDFSLDTSVNMMEDTSIEQVEDGEGDGDGLDSDELLEGWEVNDHWDRSSSNKPAIAVALAVKKGEKKQSQKQEGGVNNRRVQMKEIGAVSLNSAAAAGGGSGSASSGCADSLGAPSPLLSFFLVLLVDVFNATIEGISLGSRRHDDYSSLVSIVFRQLVVAFAFGATMEALDFQSTSLVLVVLGYSSAAPLGIFIALVSPTLRLDTLFCGLVAGVNAGLLLHFSLFHLLPRDLVINFYADNNQNTRHSANNSNSNRFRLLALLLGYVVVLIGTIYFPMQI